MQCIRCGKEMVSTTGGNEHCPKCSFAVNDLVYRPSNCDLPLPDGFWQQKGWICPVCGRGVAPHVDVCPCQGNWEITYGTVTSLNSNGGSQSTATDINSEWNKYGTYTEGK